MDEILDYDDYLDKRVEVIVTHRIQKYHKLLYMKGTVTRVSSSNIGVTMDEEINDASQYGVFLFKRHELRILEDEDMKDYKYVAIVNLLEDYNKKDYAFALFDEDEKLIGGSGHLVVVNARGKDNRVLATIKEIMPVEMYNERCDKAITAQVIGVVNMNRYIAHVEEENRLKELTKKKLEIEKELEKEINKRKSVEYYEEMAEKYSDNPKLAELVKELKGLGV